MGMGVSLPWVLQHACLLCNTPAPRLATRVGNHKDVLHSQNGKYNVHNKRKQPSTQLDSVHQ